MWLLFGCNSDRRATTFLAGDELLISWCGPVVVVGVEIIGVTLLVGVVEFNGVCVWDCVAGAILFSENVRYKMLCYKMRDKMLFKIFKRKNKSYNGLWKRIQHLRVV